MTKWFGALLMCALFTQYASADAIRASIAPPKTRKPAPQFSLMDASGKTVRLSDYRGKVTVVNFWATECGGCRLELPTFVELDQNYKSKGLIVSGISMDISYEDLKDAKEAWSKVLPFLPAHQIKYQILMGDEQVSKTYNLDAIPVTLLIDTSGRIAATYVGVVDKPNIDANVRALLAER